MSDDLSKIIIVMPCYNEAERLPVRLIDDFIRHERGRVKLILVNDGSTDRTGAIIEVLAANNENVAVLHLSRNSGKAEAIRQGILAGLREPCDAVGFWDADLATPFGELNHLLHHLGKAGVEAVTGCRLARLGANVRRGKRRHYLGRVFATAVSVLLRIGVYDSQCGAKVFGRALAERIFAAPFVSPWLFDVEILRRIVVLHGRGKTRQMVYECPLYCWEDVAGSKLTWRKMLTVPFELWKIFRRPPLPESDAAGEAHRRI